MEINKEYICSVFSDYVSAYNVEDPKIKLKIDHTYRVAALCEAIALNLCETKVVPLATESDGVAATELIIDPDLSWLTGMLHDIGRFEQVRRFNTFSDALSVDHAEFGADLLFKEGLLSSFFPDPQKMLSQNELRILELSIRNHSRYRLQEGLSKAEEQYCHILRDADKVDIFRVNCDTPMEDIYNVSTKELKSAGVTEEVKQCFKNRTAVLRPLKKTPVDHLVGHICLIFELQYPISRKIALEQGYWNKLLSFQSDNPETQAWFEYMRHHA